MNSSLAVAVVVFVMVLGLSAGYLGGTINSATTTITSVSTQTRVSSTTNTVTQSVTTTLTKSLTTTNQGGSNVVNLVLVPDFGGGGYDAFVRASNLNASTPKLATNTTAPGPDNNNITVSAGVPTRFVITNLDTAVFQNFTGTVKSPFSIYNFTEAGVIGQQYQTGQSVSNIPIGHTFTISDLGLIIPIPAGTIVTFTYTFSKPGVYVYFCQTPCGPGMSVPGYMIGYIIVT